MPRQDDVNVLHQCVAAFWKKENDHKVYDNYEEHYSTSAALVESYLVVLFSYRMTIDGKTCVFQKEKDPTVLR